MNVRLVKKYYSEIFRRLYIHFMFELFENIYIFVRHLLQKKQKKYFFTPIFFNQIPVCFLTLEFRNGIPSIYFIHFSSLFFTV